MSETEELVRFIANSTISDIPQEDIANAKRAIRDYLGVALYGSHHAVGSIVWDYISATGGTGECTVIGRGQASAPNAALANGAFGHAIDFDDTFESIVIHPTSPVFAASLAATETADGTTSDLLTGYAVGCEVAYRIGHSTYPEHYQNGWHSTGTIGSFGACAAAGSILDLDTDELVNAIGIVASLSSALKKNFGSMTKPLHAGHAAEMGVRSALLASKGFTADQAVLDGDMGYGNVMTIQEGYDPDIITSELGTQWNVTDIGYKPYPSGVITHAAMDAMRDLVEEHELSVDTVETITVSLEEAASEMLIHAQPENALQAKFSIEFCLAAILLEGQAGIFEFTDEFVEQQTTREAIDKVERDFKEDLFGDDFAGYGAIIKVDCSDGTTLETEERYAPGSPNNPLGEERLVAKFTECAGTQLSEEHVEQLQTEIENIDHDAEISSLTNLLR